MRTIAIAFAALLALPAAALAQQPGTLLPAPPVTMVPPAPPPSPVPSVVAPSAPLPGVTFQNSPSTYPSSGYVTPSYRSKAPVKRCNKRRGRCPTS